MTIERTYFDWNATAPLRAEARAAMTAALDHTGNASSVHGEGRAARKLIEAAREQVAALVGASPKNVTFTSGGTEANMLALTPAIEVGGLKAPRDRLLISSIEHLSVRAGGRFTPEQIQDVPVVSNGQIDFAALKDRLKGTERALVSVMLANNETGVVQPIREAAEIVHEASGLLHVDAVQGAGRIPCDIAGLGADMMTISAHKLGGPQGIGALIRRDEALHIAQPLIKGGGQERGARGGTENVAAIAGFGAAAAAAKLAMEQDARRMTALRERLEAGLRATAPSVVFFGHDSPRIPNTTLFAVAGLKAETAIISFDINGIAVSSGSACSSGKVAASHVLAAMGVAPELARGAVRVSLGWSTTEDDIEQFLNAWNKVSSSLLKEQRGIAA